MKIKNAWNCEKFPIDMIVESLDGVRHLVRTVPSRVIGEDDLRDFYGFERVDSFDEVSPLVLAMYGLEKDESSCSDGIKVIRKRTGLSQVAFCAALGIPRRTLESWEMGARECPSYVLSLITYRVMNDKTFCCKPD